MACAREGACRDPFALGAFVGGQSGRLRDRLWGEAVGRAVHREDLDMVGEAIEQRASEALVAERPLVEGQVRGGRLDLPRSPSTFVIHCHGQ